MSLGPILPGRLPNSLATQRLRNSVAANKLALQRVQDQLTTGQQYLVASESPAKALRAIVLQKSLERKDQFLSNVQTNRSLVNATEDALQSVTESINTGKELLLQGFSSNLAAPEREALANEVSTLITSITTAGNAKFRGRFLFGGSESGEPPFQQIASNQVLYRGDSQSIESFVDFDQQIINNVDGVTAFNPLTTVRGTDLNIALTLETRISDLHGGRGVDLAAIDVTVNDGTSLTGHAVDLAGAETLADIKLRIEDAFSADAVSVTVDIDPTSKFGLKLTPSTGTISVANQAGSRVASDLGIASTEVAEISGADLDPRITLASRIADFNGGTGIGPTAGNGLHIVNGLKTAVVDISSAETVEDLFNIFKLSGLDVISEINDSGNAINISSRINGADFSIGENNGNNASLLGVRTLRTDTVLTELNQGTGLDSAAAQKLEITRRDGSQVSVDLATAKTINDVISAINAVDPGNLTASLNAVGNGISIVDLSGTGTLAITDNPLAQSLGLVGEDASGDPSAALIGKDINKQHSTGLVSVLSRLERALRSNDLRQLGKLDQELETEADRFFSVRGIVGTRQRALDEAESRLSDEKITLNEGLANDFDVDLSVAVTEFVSRQQTLEATYQAASQALQLNLLAFL